MNFWVPSKQKSYTGGTRQNQTINFNHVVSNSSKKSLKVLKASWANLLTKHPVLKFQFCRVFLFSWKINIIDRYWAFGYASKAYSDSESPTNTPIHTNVSILELTLRNRLWLHDLFNCVYFMRIFTEYSGKWKWRKLQHALCYVL